MDQFHLVTRRDLEPDRFALPDLVAGGDALHADPVGLDTGFEPIEIVGLVDLEGESVDTDAGVEPHRERVMVALVPALEEDPIIGALADVEPHDLRVVRSRELEIRDRDVDVAEPENPHDGGHSTSPVPFCGKSSRIAERVVYSCGR